MLHDRRLMNFIRDSVVERTEWALAARADQRDVWGQLAYDVASFLELLWRGGALAGTTAAEAYGVRCDDLTNGGDYERVICMRGMVALPTGGPVAFRVIWSLA